MEEDTDKGKPEDKVTRESEDELSEEALDEVSGGTITVRKAGGTQQDF
jgi:hypothetical protein